MRSNVVSLYKNATFVNAKLKPTMLENEFKYYLENQEDLLKKFKGKFIVIKNNQVIGAYDSEIQALTETKKDHEIGTFLIQKVTPGNNDYTETYHSRVNF